MNGIILGNVLRDMSRQIGETGLDRVDGRDVGELLRVLARIAEGKPLARAFGAPGDWGYGTAIGKALAARPPKPEQIAESAGAEGGEG
ncbi:MAG: hypothetical protein WCR06_07715 [bacterium]